MSEHAPVILDIAGLALTEVDRDRLAHPLAGGIILFGRNWQDRNQLGALCAEIKSVRQDLLICVDQEGGKSAVLYQTNLKMLDMKTHKIVWNGQKKIRKFVQRSKAGW